MSATPKPDSCPSAIENTQTPSQQRKRPRNYSTDSSSSASPQLDSKRLKQLLSVSSTEDSICEFAEADLTVTSTDLNMAPTMNQIEIKLNELVEKMKVELLEEIKKVVEDVVDERINKVNEHMKEMKENVKEQIKIEVERVTKNMVTKEELHEKVNEVKAMAVHNEQYSRKSNIRIFGLKENQHEDTIHVVLRLFEEKLEINLEETDIDVAHRLGRSSPNKPRGIIVKFLRRAHKMEVMRARRRLKGTGMIIVDDLCKGVYALFNRVKNDARVANVWTWTGKVFFVARGSDRVRQIKYGERLDQVLNRD